MGQRHQYVIVYPRKYLNAGNCNNRPERAEVIHHQWLYGRNAILALDRVLRLAANTWEGEGSDYLFGRDESGYTGGDGTRAIAAAVSVDPDVGYYHNVSPWEAADWNGMEGRERSSGYCEPQGLEPDMFDNNDGITLIRFQAGEKLPGYAFIAPSHLEGSHWKDSHGLGPWSAREYLEFYYSRAEQAEFDAETQGLMRNAFDRIDRLSRLMTDSEVASLLPKFKTRRKGRSA